MIIKTDKRSLNPTLRKAVYSYNRNFRRYLSAMKNEREAEYRYLSDCKKATEYCRDVHYAQRDSMDVLVQLGLVTLDERGFASHS